MRNREWDLRGEKSRTENRGEGLHNTERDADWDKETEKVKTVMGWRTCF